MERDANVHLRYIVDVVNRASRSMLADDKRIRASAVETGATLRRQANEASRAGAQTAKVSAERVRVNAREDASWKALERTATSAERQVGQAAIETAGRVSRASQQQVEAMRKQGASYRTIVRQQREVGASARETAAAVEASARREAAALSRTTAASRRQVTRGAAGATAAGRTSGALSSATSLLGFGGALGLAGAVKQTVDFDRSMRNVNSLLHLSEKNFKSLGGEVLKLAGKTAQTPKALAEGLYDLASSGFKGKDAMTVLAASARAATAGLSTTEVSTAAVAAVLNAYHRPAADAAKVSDDLFQTVNLGVIKFDQLASTIGDVLPFASQLHVGLNQVGASIATMTKAGIKPEETMTRIKNVMVSLIKPSVALKGAYKKLGVESGEQLIKQKGFQGALDALTGTTNGSKEALAKLFPNIRSLGGALALTGQNSKAANADMKRFKDTSGANSKVLAEQVKSVSLQWLKLRADTSAVAITIGQALIPPVMSVVHWFREHKTVTKDLAIATGALVTALVGYKVINSVIEMVKGLGAAWRKVRTSALGAAEAETLASRAGGGGAGRLGRLGRVGRVAGGAAAIGAGVALSGGVPRSPLSGAATGAAAGMFFGPWGAAGGAAIGAGVGYARAQDKKAEQQINKLMAQLAKSYQRKLAPAVASGDIKRIDQLASSLEKVTRGSPLAAHSLRGVRDQVTAAQQAFHARTWDIATNLAAGFQKAHVVNRSNVDRMVKTFLALPPAARRETANAMVAMVRELESKGQLPKRSADQLIAGINAKWPGLVHPASKATTAMASVAGGAFNNLAAAGGRAMAGLDREVKQTSDSVYNTTRSTAKEMDRLSRQLSGMFSQIGSVAGKLADAGAQVKLPKGMAVGGRVPGDPTRDGTPILAAGNEFMVTGGGERILENMTFPGVLDWLEGTQPRHFAAGGRIVKGRASTFGPPGEGAGRTAYGRSSADPGVSLRWPGTGFDSPQSRALGMKWYDVRVGGRHAVLQDIDKGPHESTGRVIDVTGAGARKMGLSQSRFPTDQIGTAVEVTAGTRAAKGLVGSGGGSRQATTYSLGKALDAADTMFKGYQAGLEGKGLGDITKSAVAAASAKATTRSVSAPGLRGAAKGGNVSVAGLRGRGLVGLGHLLQAKGFHPGEHPAFGGVTTSAHAHYGAGDHYSGGAIDVGSGSKAGHQQIQSIAWAMHKAGRLNFYDPARMISALAPRATPVSWFRADHADHVHISGHRKGGRVPRRGFAAGGRIPRFAAGGRIGRGREHPRRSVTRRPRVPTIRQRLTGLERAGVADTKPVTASLEGIAKLIDGFTYGHLASTVALIARESKHAKSNTVKQRLANALALVQGEMGRRIGGAVKQATDAIEGLDAVRTHSDRNLRRAGIDGSSVAGAQINESVSRGAVQTINSSLGVLNRQLATARKTKNKKMIADIQGKIKDTLDKLDEATAGLADAVRATIEAQRQAMLAAIAEVGDAAGHTTSISSSQEQLFETEQRLSKTFDTVAGREARASRIRRYVIPQLQAEMEANRQQAGMYNAQGDLQGQRQAELAYWAKANEIAQAQLDANEAIEANTKDAADALKEYVGSSVTEFHGQQFSDLARLTVGA